MEHFHYAIIGGGMTADSAVSGIREFDPSGHIALFSLEPHPPYDRPPLTKGLWLGKPLESIWRKTLQEKISFFPETKIISIDSKKKMIRSEDGRLFGYDKLLLATGGQPLSFSFPTSDIIYFRTLNDYFNVRALCASGNDFVVIGGGFIGTELAAALRSNGKNVTLIFPQATLGAHYLPSTFSSFLNAFFTEKGIRLVPNDHVVSIEKIEKGFRLLTRQGKILSSHAVVAGLGINPRIELAQACGLKTENGIVVDSRLQTSQPDIFAAGDCANFYNPALDQRVRIEHEDAANSMGKMAGKNMTGQKENYYYLPFFYSDLFELGYEAIGELSSTMEIIEHWEDLYRKGTLYYFKDGKLKGALCLNIWNQIDNMRKKIENRTTVADIGSLQTG